MQNFIGVVSGGVQSTLGEVFRLPKRLDVCEVEAFSLLLRQCKVEGMARLFMVEMPASAPVIVPSHTRFPKGFDVRFERGHCASQKLHCRACFCDAALQSHPDAVSHKEANSELWVCALLVPHIVHTPSPVFSESHGIGFSCFPVLFGHRACSQRVFVVMLSQRRFCFFGMRLPPNTHPVTVAFQNDFAMPLPPHPLIFPLAVCVGGVKRAFETAPCVDPVPIGQSPLTLVLSSLLSHASIC